MNRSQVYEIVRLVIAEHPKDCIFDDNALEKATDEVLTKVTDWMDYAQVTALFEDAIQGQELYCPHEGIDRRG